MAVVINDSCIACDACLQNCLVGAIADDNNNPVGKNYYYVKPEKCIECVGLYDSPQCASICPSIGCITWDMPYTKEFEAHFLDNEKYKISQKDGVVKTPSFREKKYRTDIPIQMRGVGQNVEVAPDSKQAV